MRVCESVRAGLLVVWGAGREVGGAMPGGPKLAAESGVRSTI